MSVFKDRGGAMTSPAVGVVLRFLDRLAQRARRQYLKRLAATWLGLAVLMIMLAALAKPILLGLGIGAALAVGWLAARWLGRKGRAEVLEAVWKAIEALRAKILAKEKELKTSGDDPAKANLRALLAAANDEERAQLERIAGKRFRSAEQFERVLRRKATHEGKILARKLRGVEEAFALASYADMLDMAGKSVGVKRNGMPDHRYEEEIVRKAFSEAVGKLEERRRRMLERELAAYAERKCGQQGWRLSLTASSLAAAKMGGFSTYMLASSLLASFSSALGLSLSFGVYTGLSSALSVVLGPAGWAALGAYAAHRLLSPDEKSNFMAVLVLASIRGRLVHEREARLAAIQKDKDRLCEQKRMLEELAKHMEAASSMRETLALLDGRRSPVRALLQSATATAHAGRIGDSATDGSERKGLPQDES